jgi:hypothetical protein
MLYISGKFLSHEVKSGEAVWYCYLKHTVADQLNDDHLLTLNADTYIETTK